MVARGQHGDYPSTQAIRLMLAPFVKPDLLPSGVSLTSNASKAPCSRGRKRLFGCVADFLNLGALGTLFGPSGLHGSGNPHSLGTKQPVEAHYAHRQDQEGEQCDQPVRRRPPAGWGGFTPRSLGYRRDGGLTIPRCGVSPSPSGKRATAGAASSPAGGCTGSSACIRSSAARSSSARPRPRRRVLDAVAPNRQRIA